MKLFNRKNKAKEAREKKVKEYNEKRRLFSRKLSEVRKDEEAKKKAATAAAAVAAEKVVEDVMPTKQVDEQQPVMEEQQPVVVQQPEQAPVDTVAPVIKTSVSGEQQNNDDHEGDAPTAEPSPANSEEEDNDSHTTPPTPHDETSSNIETIQPPRKIEKVDDNSTTHTTTSPLTGLLCGCI